jgi:cytoskeletal protein RodZ
MRRMNERGSVVGFIVVGVLLAALAIGGVYALNKYNSSHSTTSSTNTTSDNSSTPADNSTATPSPQPAATNSSEPSSGQTQPDQSASTDDNKLPQTGPVDTIVAFVAAALLAMCMVAYLRSRHEIASL